MSTDFPKRLPEKLTQIRKRLGLSLDQIAERVGAKNGAEILSYENDEGELPVTVLWAYARLAANPIMNLIDDDLEVNFVNN
jgi:transcriptional regulator with XRE-family HTH domain